MYDSQLFRLNIKGIKTEFDEKNKLLKLTIVPFVDYKSEKKLPFEVSKLLEKKAETVITLDFSKSFDSDSHKNIYSLLHDLSRIQWFKTKNVIIEHSWDDEAGYETIAILSNSEDSIELQDKLVCGYDTTKGKKVYFCTVDTNYFLGIQDCPYVRNTFVNLNETNVKTIHNDDFDEEQTAIETVIDEATDLVEEIIETQPVVKDALPSKYYSTKREALKEIPMESRKVGMVVWVKLSKSKPKAYAWVGGISDKELLPVV